MFAPIAFIRAAERTQAEGHASGPHSFSVRDYGAIGDGATPVVPDDGSSLLAEVMNQTEHVINQQINLVILNAHGFVAQVVAARIGCDDSVIVAERHQLMPP